MDFDQEGYLIASEPMGMDQDGLLIYPEQVVLD